MPSIPLPSTNRTSVLLVFLAALFLAVGPAAPAAAQPLPQEGAIGPLEDPFEGQNIVSIEVIGERRYSEAKLLSALGLRSGQPYSADRAEEGIQYLWRIFQVRAQVKGKTVEGGVALRLLVTELPVDLEPRFIGNAEIELEELLEWAQLEDRRELYLHQVNRVTGLLLAGYKRAGYYFAEVRPVVREISEGDDTATVGDVIFEIVEGPEVNVKEVVIHGNQSLPDRGFGFWKDGLSELAGLELGGPSLFDWDGEEFVEETLRADIVAMRNVYRDAGFLNAVVDLDRLEFYEDRTGVIVHIIVDEGEPFVVSKVSIQGFDLVPHPQGEAYLPQEMAAELLYPEEDLLTEVVLTPGKRYERIWINADHIALRDYYGGFGHIEHATLGDRYTWRWLEPELVFDLEKSEVEVIYRIAQGRPVKIREIKIAGATHTQDRVIRREISVEPGHLADMKEILASLRRLTSSGYFSDDRNRLEHRDPTFRFIPTDEAGEVDIEFIVEEGRVVDFGISGGIDSNTGLFGLISLTMNNFDLFDVPDSFFGMFGEIYRKEAFHGAGQTLQVMVSPGTQRDQARLRFVEPDIFRLHKDRIAFDGELAKYDQIFEDYDQKRTIRAVQLGRQLGFNSMLWLGYSNEDVTIYDVDPQVDLTDPALAPLAQEVGSNSLNGLTLSLRHRDTDAAFNPKEGRDVRINSEWKTHVLGSDWEFVKGTLTWDEYLPIGSDPSEVRSGFRIAAGAGIASPYGRSDLIPYSERYFLGGYNTVRGFRYRGVGPYAASGTPIGGENMLRGSLEYRYPIYSITQPGTYRKVEMLRLQFFVDSGVLGPEYGRLDLNETRASWGFGFGLTYPFPLVFDFAWPLREGPLDRTQVFSFNIAAR